MKLEKVYTTSAHIFCLLLVDIATVRTQQLPKSNLNAAARQKSFFLMDLNGSYRYSFDTGNGIASEQRADAANEVTGQYTYIEKGIPYMVKYRAGRHGYQPEVMPTGAQSNHIAHHHVNGGTNVVQTILPPLNGIQSQHRIAPLAVVPTVPVIPTTLISHRHTQPSYQFIQAALQTMQSQPLHMSFNSQHSQLQQLNNNHIVASTARTAINPALITQINRVSEPIGATSKAHAEPKRPYEFAYGSNGDLSARSERSDAAGNVVGKYSYRDEAGFHELNYKAGGASGFQIVGGNLANSNGVQTNGGHLIAASNGVVASANGKANSNVHFPLNVINGGGQKAPQLVVSVTHEPNVNFSYQVQPLQAAVSNTLKDDHGRTLRKF